MAIKREKMKKNTGMESLYDVRLEKKIEELRWLYMELYGNTSMFAELCDQMKSFYQNRAEALRNLIRKEKKIPSGIRKMTCME